MKRYDGPDDGDAIERALEEAAGRDLDRAVARGIRLESDRIVSLILGGEAARDEVEGAIGMLRAGVLEVFPQSGELFDAIYLGRFRRLWNQFRPDEEPL